MDQAVTRRARLVASILLVTVLLVTACSSSDSTDDNGSVATTTGQGGPSGEFTSLAYNVAGLPEGMSSSNPSVNSPLISPLLNGYDLVLLQEDWGDPDPDEIPEGTPEFLLGLDLFHDDIVSQAEHEFQSDPAPLPLGQDDSRPDALVADGLNRLSVFPYGEITRVRWDDCNGVTDGASDCLSEKGFSMATTTLADGVEVDVYNLHAEAGGGDADQVLRVADFEQLAEFINENSAGKAIILGGDTNLQTGEGEEDDVIWRTFLDATGIVAVCDTLDCGGDGAIIDKFAYRSGGGVTLEPLTHEFMVDVFVRDDGEPLSDHDALAVTWAWSTD